MRIQISGLLKGGSPIMSFETMFNVANMQETAKISGAGEAFIKSMKKSYLHLKYRTVDFATDEPLT